MDRTPVRRAAPVWGMPGDLIESGEPVGRWSGTPPDAGPQPVDQGPNFILLTAA
jgi:hypothetical protein